MFCFLNFIFQILLFSIICELPPRMEFWRRKIATSALEKCYDNRTGRSAASGGAATPFVNNKSKDFLNEDLVSSVMPPVTVVLEGRSICHRISLHKHASYGSLAKALRQMFVDGNADDAGLDLSNAIPGHLIAYEDMENDLLLVGDLSWKDFVRVARRIRILPRKSNSGKGSIC